MFKKKQTSADRSATERQIYNLTKLVNINSMINSTLDIARLLTVIMETIKDIMATEASTLLLYDDKSGDLVFKVALGEAGKELAERYRIKLGQGIAGWVAETRKPVYINNAYQDRRFDPDFDKITGFTTRSIICIPLLFKGKLLGVIQAINRSDGQEFSEDDMALFKVFGDQAALAVQNAIYFQNALEEERITSELSAARAIQETLIPVIDMEVDGIRIAAKSMTAREIGSEFHSLFRFDADHIGIAMGDLHMKGVPGGMRASIVSGAIRALAKMKGGNPVELVRILHLVMEHDDQPIKNTSLLYGVFDIPDRTLRFLNAGIAYPILVRDGVARYLRFGKRSLSQNIEEAKSVAVSLKNGDLFVIISDGLIRVRNRTGKQLGLKSMMDHFEKKFSRSEDIIESAIEFARDFSGDIGIRDDISIITIRVG